MLRPIGKHFKMSKKSAPTKFQVTSITVTGLAISVGLLQIAIATLQLTPQISPEYYRDAKISFNAYSKSLSFLHSFIDRVTLATYLRIGLSAIQVVFGAFLLDKGYFGTLSKVGNYGLISVNLIVLVLQLLSGVSLERYGPSLVFIVLLSTRLLLIYQSQQKSKVGVRTRNEGRPKTSTPKKNRSD